MPDRSLEESLNQAIEAILAGTMAASDTTLDALVQVAAALREMPDENFRLRLKTDLQRRTSMTGRAAISVREGFRTVTPYITVQDGDRLVEFLKHAFAAEELLRSRSEAGFHSEIRIGDSILMIGWAESLRTGQRIGAFHIYVPDCDGAYQRALDAGATSMGVPEDRPYGERSGFVKDFAGNHWYIATRLSEVVAPEGAGTVMPFLYPGKARAFIEFVKRAFAAEEMGVFEESGRVMHAAVRIGDSVLEMGEPAEEMESMPGRFFLYVDDCDGLYRRALAAGAISVEAPADRSYGRTAVILDPFGYEWVPSSFSRPAA
jgi:uncharacterized glyoxalase superfamily protein PhnB